ncbi:hypothetical protein G6F68_017793 [Rhizopus microsporus]|nr:hypothetical protein G6F68_017793 [Rhizopus microsporus]
MLETPLSVEETSKYYDVDTFDEELAVKETDNNTKPSEKEGNESIKQQEDQQHEEEGEANVDDQGTKVVGEKEERS